MERHIQGKYYAAVDLGSNSFHMVVVYVANGNVQIVNKIKQKVRLAAGLDDSLMLSQDSINRGIACLETFSERLQDVPRQHIKIVATATLRIAKNAHVFLEQAKKVLNHKIDVISGEEEARQIYLGVAYTSAVHGNMLVIDIGGASTEVIIGNDMHPIHMRSLNMGCVTFMDRYFANGELTRQNFQQAKKAATALLNEIEQEFLCFDWQHCLGASGTPQAITEILISRGISDAIRLDYLLNLETECIAFSNVEKLDIAGLAESRQAIFPSGLAILIALFERLQLRTMNISGGALREGLIYGMLDNSKESDRQQQSLNIAISRYHIDKEHANLVQQAAFDLCEQFCAQVNVCHFDTSAVLNAAAILHEIGLHIEYKQYHQHGAYILEYVTLPGFTRLQRSAIRDLVKSHRGNLNLTIFDPYHEEVKEMLCGLLRILRLAVVLCIRRNGSEIPKIQLTVKENSWTLLFPQKWLKSHPLIQAELTNEAWLQHRVGWTLKLQ